MKGRLNSKSVLAILFVAMIFIGGIATLLVNPVEVLGGLVRGYISAPEGSNILQRIGNSFKTFDERASEYFAFHDASVHAYGGIQRMLGRKLIDNAGNSYDVVKLNNGYLTFKSGSHISFTELTDYLLELKASTDRNFMFVSQYNKQTGDRELYPAFYPYVPTSDAEENAIRLEESGITVLDPQKIAQQQNIDKYSQFFRTDHHWTPQTGLWITENICTQLNETYGWNLDADLYDISNYTVETYPDACLGSEGKRVGALYTGLDDFSVITPNFETCLTVDKPYSDFHVTGDFREVFIRESYITPDNLLNKDAIAYDTYLQGNHPLVKVRNQNVPDGKKALLIMDSYGCVVAPYLSLTFRELHCIDVRFYSDSVEDYINDTAPDIVIYATANHQ